MKHPKEMIFKETGDVLQWGKRFMSRYTAGVVVVPIKWKSGSPKNSGDWFKAFCRIQSALDPKKHGTLVSKQDLSKGYVLVKLPAPPFASPLSHKEQRLLCNNLIEEFLGIKRNAPPNQLLLNLEDTINVGMLRNLVHEAFKRGHGFTKHDKNL